MRADFIFKKSNCHRYGTKWAQWREIGQNDSLRELEWLEASLAAGVEDGTEETLDLGFDARLQITSVTGTSLNSTGDTCLLKAKLSNGVNWGPHGDKTPSDELSKRPSPYFPPFVLSHLSVVDRPTQLFYIWIFICCKYTNLKDTAGESARWGGVCSPAIMLSLDISILAVRYIFFNN